MNSNNLHYAYTVEYYKSLSWDRDIKSETNTKITKNNNRALLQYTAAMGNNDFPLCGADFPGLERFELKTVYPGLLIGSGNDHKVGAEGEAALGFTFDYVTGIPYIPGSSVKGVLRSAFKGPKWEYIKEVGTDCGIPEELLQNRSDVNKLEDAIFSSDDSDAGMTKNRIVFFDAWMSLVPSGGRFLAKDAITSHRQGALKELSEPNPVTFIRILPDVGFTFRFYIPAWWDETETVPGREPLIKLFRQILLDFGIGAKTNVGYGTLVDSGRDPGSPNWTAVTSVRKGASIQRNVPAPRQSHVAPQQTRAGGRLPSVDTIEAGISLTAKVADNNPEQKYVELEIEGYYGKMRMYRGEIPGRGSNLTKGQVLNVKTVKSFDGLHTNASMK